MSSNHYLQNNYRQIGYRICYHIHNQITFFKGLVEVIINFPYLFADAFIQGHFLVLASVESASKTASGR